MSKAILSDQKLTCLNCGRKNSVLFCDLRHRDLAFLSNNKETKHYKKGEIVFREGTNPRGLYCISSGKVKLHRLSPDGKERIVHFAKTGDVLGHVGLFTNSHHSTSATTLEESLICIISKNAFLEKLKESPGLYLETIQFLANEIHQNFSDLASITQKNAKKLMANMLLMLINIFGFKEDQQTLDVYLTRKEIGEILGLTTETAIRVLSQLQKERIVELDKKSIVILDESGLIQLTQKG